MRGGGRWTVCAALCRALLCPVALAGCGGAANQQMAKPDPQQAAAAAIAALDANDDGILSAAELQESPGLQTAMPRLDVNRDGALSADEIAGRLQAYQSMSDMVAVGVRVLLNGQPLAGAAVTLVPEPFLGEGLQSYVGVTTDRGTAFPKGQRVKLAGVPVGLYRAHIRHEEQNVDETRGVEVADDTRASEIDFSL